MSTAGPNLPTVASTSARGSATDWTNPNNALTEDGTFATSASGAAGTYFLNLDTMGWAIAAGSTISNALVEVKGKISAGTNSALAVGLYNTSNTLQVDNGGVSGSFSTTNAWVTGYNGDPPAGFDSYVTGNTDRYRVYSFNNDGLTWSVDALRVTLTYTVPVTGYKNLPLLGVGLINTLIHTLTLGLCSWRWRPFTRTQTRTAGVMA